MILLLAFVNMAALDLAWVGYNRATAQGRKAWGVAWAMVLALLGGVNAIAVVGDAWNLLGTVLGAGVGTTLGLYVVPWLERRGVPKLAPLASMPTVGDERKIAIEAALLDVGAELNRARLKFAPFHSAHEGYAVALEEVDELRAHVWAKQSTRDLDKMRAEAIQAAAMFTAFAAECCGEESGRV